MVRKLGLLLVLVALLESPAPSQSLLQSVLGDGIDDAFGLRLDGLGDLDGDGVPEFVVLDPSLATGRVIVFSGSDGSIVFEIPDNDARDVAGIGDVDGDGLDDFAIGSPYDDTGGANSGTVRVRSGADGSVLHTFVGRQSQYMGEVVAGIGDINRDGVPDVAAGTPECMHACSPGFVHVWSGLDGALLHTLDVTGAARAIDGVGDVNGDGYGDVLIGDGRLLQVAVIHSGLDGSVLRSWSPAGQPGFGDSVSALGDLDGDGVTDVLIGAFLASRVFAYSGANGRLLFTLDGTPFTRFGISVAGVGDATGDGVPDFVVGAIYEPRFVNIGAVYFYSGADRALQHVLRGPAPGSRLGTQVAAAGDVDGDGIGDFMASAPRLFVEPGVVHVWSAACLVEPMRYCVAMPNSVSPVGAVIDAAGTLSIFDDDFGLSVEQLPPLTFGIFVYGAGAAALPFGDGVLCVSPFAPGLHRLLPADRADAAGRVERALGIASLPPGGSIVAGATVHFQLLYRDARGGPAGFNGSDALAATFCP